MVVAPASGRIWAKADRIWRNGGWDLVDVGIRSAMSTAKGSKRLMSMRLAASPDSVRAARDGMKTLRRYLSPQRLDDVRLMVSEITTNCIRHGALPENSQISVAVDLEGDILTVEVSDGGRGFKPHRVPPLPRSSGWGLFLVGRLADSWGMSSDGSTTVWFQVLARPTTAADRGPW